MRYSCQEKNEISPEFVAEEKSKGISEAIGNVELPVILHDHLRSFIGTEKYPSREEKINLFCQQI